MSSLRAPVGATENHTLDKNNNKSTFAGIFFHPHLPMLWGRFNTTVLCPLWKYGIEAPLFLTKAPDKTLGGRDRGANKSGQGSTWSASSISLLSKAKWFGINCLNPFTYLETGTMSWLKFHPSPSCHLSPEIANLLALYVLTSLLVSSSDCYLDLILIQYLKMGNSG